MRPTLKPTVLLSPVDDGYLAYDIAAEQLHRLNPLAALIVELADGQRSEVEILNAVSPLVGPQNRSGCAEWLQQAIEQTLLVPVEQASKEPPFTAAQLNQFAIDLRGQNRVLAAFLCQQRAAELAPDDPQQAYQLGELAHIVGRRAEARQAYEKYLAAFPNDAEIEHVLIALRDEAPPTRASDRCIEQLYEHFASFYDENMCSDLDYRAPDLLLAALLAATGNRRDLVTLDAGCGTGLFGKLIKPNSQRLVGIDLSQAMIERARERGIYDQLDKAELTAYFAGNPTEKFDLIAICDTLIYFGDLAQVLPNAARFLKPGGIVGFTVEQSHEAPFRLTDSGRFAHHVDHLRQVAQSGGYRIVSQTEEILRYEYGEPVIGWVTVLQSSP